MRFRTKILLILLPLVLGGQALVAQFLDERADREIVEAFRSKALSVASSAAAVVDGDAYQRLLEHPTLDTPEYVSIRAQLKSIRDANRRKDSWVKFLYTVYPAPSREDLLLYGVDPEEDLEQFSRIGDVVHGRALKDIDIRNAHALDEFVVDAYGSWLSAMHPIRNSKGEVVGAVVADIDSSQVMDQVNEFFSESLVVFGASAALALFVSLLIARWVSRPLEKIEHAIAEIGRGNFDTPIEIKSRDEFGAAALALKEMALGLKERERVKNAFARYVSHQVADTVLKGSDASMLKGERRRITVLFSDIRGFTTMSERLSPENVVLLLNEYFERMVDIVFKHQGTLDKFIGDGIMAIFGAPYEDSYQEEHAVRAALEMRAALAEIAQKAKQQFGIDLRIGIGINSGLAIVGNIGSSKRMDYTAIGDTVNLASRLESRTKEEGVDLLLSEYTYAALRGTFGDTMRKVGSVHVKGRDEAVVAYTVEAAVQ